MARLAALQAVVALEGVETAGAVGDALAGAVGETTTPAAVTSVAVAEAVKTAGAVVADAAAASRWSSVMQLACALPSSLQRMMRPECSASRLQADGPSSPNQVHSMLKAPEANSSAGLAIRPLVVA